MALFVDRVLKLNNLYNNCTWQNLLSFVQNDSINIVAQPKNSSVGVIEKNALKDLNNDIKNILSWQGMTHAGLMLQLTTCLKNHVSGSLVIQTDPKKWTGGGQNREETLFYKADTPSVLVAQRVYILENGFDTFWSVQANSFVETSTGEVKFGGPCLELGQKHDVSPIIIMIITFINNLVKNPLFSSVL